MCARIAVLNLFQVDLDKTWTYLWNLLCKGTRFSPFKRAGRLCLRNAPPFRRPWARAIVSRPEKSQTFLWYWYSFVTKKHL